MPDQPAFDSMIQKLNVRSYQVQDQQVVAHLYNHGLLQGQIAPNDTGADIDNIHDAYFNEDANHFWVGELDDNIVGMIGVARDREHIAEIRRLRVEKDFQQTPIAEKLIETALSHCNKHGFLKIVLDTRFDPNAVMDLFDRFGFQHTRTKEAAGKELLEFYLDLYRDPKPEDQASA